MINQAIITRSYATTTVGHILLMHDRWSVFDMGLSNAVRGRDISSLLLIKASVLLLGLDVSHLDMKKQKVSCTTKYLIFFVIPRRTSCTIPYFTETEHCGKVPIPFIPGRRIPYSSPRTENRTGARVLIRQQGRITTVLLLSVHPRGFLAQCPKLILGQH